MSTTICFDPMNDLFVAQFAKPPELTEINLRTLTPFQRALLTIDGTVTKFIEAYTLEPVEVIRLAQARKRLSEDHAWLEAPQGSEVIARNVLLRTKFSRTVHAFGFALILPDRIPAAFAERLERDGEALGRILADRQMETRREVLWYGAERVQTLPEPFSDFNHHEFITRVYRIITGGKPMMLINERFPYEADGLRSHQDV